MKKRLIAIELHNDDGRKINVLIPPWWGRFVGYSLVEINEDGEMEKTRSEAPPCV